MTAIEEVCVFSKSPTGHISQLGDRRMMYIPQGVSGAGVKTVKEVWHGRSYRDWETIRSSNRFSE